MVPLTGILGVRGHEIRVATVRLERPKPATRRGAMAATEPPKVTLWTGKSSAEVEEGKDAHLTLVYQVERALARLGVLRLQFFVLAPDEPWPLTVDQDDFLKGSFGRRFHEATVGLVLPQPRPGVYRYEFHMRVERWTGARRFTPSIQKVPLLLHRGVLDLQVSPPIRARRTRPSGSLGNRPGDG